MEKNISNKALKKSLTLLNNKYKFEIIYYLSSKTLRFGELKKKINTITQQLLTKLLREMEKDQIINKKNFTGFPRRVDYSLTDLGKSIKPIINSILKWEIKNSKAINKIVKKNVLDSIYDYY
jgi:DNA-binding HxlR family transcriptional regulator